MESPIEYPVVSISYCVKCNWMLRACWYQQELLQTFTAKAASADEAIIRSVVLKPCYTPGTFKVYVKPCAAGDWVLVWDRVENGGFPEAKALKQALRNILSPETRLGHSDTKSKGVLVSNSPPAPQPIARVQSHTPTESDLQIYGSPKLAATHKTFCEECLDKLPPAWEM